LENEGAGVCNFEQIEFEGLPSNLRDIVTKENYDSKTALVSGTRFFLLTRKKSVFVPEKFEVAIKKYWPQFATRFNLEVPPVSLIDIDSGLGGSPKGEYIVGVASSEVISRSFSETLSNVTGWIPKKSTKDYVVQYWGKFNDPFQAYIDDMVIHELGHVFFGYGFTKVKEPNQEWFSLGLGMVYDRLVWDTYHASKSPLFEEIDRVWRTKFADREDIDQKLINPDTSNDKAVGLDRLQIYGHGKSNAFLSELRNTIGESVFDDVVARFIVLKNREKENICYESFINFFRNWPGVPND
jgi:hypothetical protein